MDLAEMHTRAVEFGLRIDQVKADVEGPPWGWYPWKMLPEFIVRLDAMLTGENRSVLDRPAGTRVADIGAADGDFSFFLESVGFKVDIVDGGAGEIKELRLQPPTILKKALGSSVEIHGVDLDGEFELPRKYDLAFCLGVLYHLKNPFLALETLARSTRHCIISTKVARYVQMPGRFGRRTRVDISDVPIAYLLDTYEVSKTDSTNYWVFSETSLRRLVNRAGWTMLDCDIAGNADNAEPASQYEARAWCLLRSEVFEEA